MDTIIKDEHCFCNSSTESVWAKQEREPHASGRGLRDAGLPVFQGVTVSVPWLSQVFHSFLCSSKEVFQRQIWAIQSCFQNRPAVNSLGCRRFKVTVPGFSCPRWSAKIPLWTDSWRSRFSVLQTYPQIPKYLVDLYCDLYALPALLLITLLHEFYELNSKLMLPFQFL